MYRKYRQGWMKHLDFMIIDMLCLQIAFILSYVIRHGLQNPYLDMDYRNLAIFIEVADIAIIYIFETFQDVLKRGYYQEFAVTLKHSILIMLVAWLISARLPFMALNSTHVSSSSSSGSGAINAPPLFRVYRFQIPPQ